jgi:hypothetical protein
MRCTSAWIFAALFVAIASMAHLNAQDKPLPAASMAVKSDAGVEQLISDLGSDDYRTREKAGRELVAKGDKVLPQLRNALSTTDNPEVQRRLHLMVRKLDYERLVTPKYVKLSLKDKTAKEALAEISRQTDYKIEYRVNGKVAEAKFSFEFDNIPFWQALDKVASAAGCVALNDYNEESIEVHNQDSTNPYVAYSGPYRFLATNINSNKSVQLSGVSRRGAGPARQEFMNLNFQIQSEPKNPMLGITQVDVITANDELGGSLIAPSEPNNHVNYFYNNPGMGRGHNTFGNVSLSRSDKAATTIKLLKAKAGIILLSGTTPEIIVTNPLKVAKKTFAGRSVEIEVTAFTELANAKGHYQLEMIIRKLGGIDPNRPEDANWMNNVWQKIDILDAAGNRYQTAGPINFDPSDFSAVQVTIPFEPNDRRTGQATKFGPPAKLVFNEWLSVLHEVTFEFRDIPLP